MYESKFFTLQKRRKLFVQKLNLMCLFDFSCCVFWSLRNFLFLRFYNYLFLIFFWHVYFPKNEKKLNLCLNFLFFANRRNEKFLKARINFFLNKPQIQKNSNNTAIAFKSKIHYPAYLLFLTHQ